jgi:hypothetical protein
LFYFFVVGEDKCLSPEELFFTLGFVLYSNYKETCGIDAVSIGCVSAAEPSFLQKSVSGRGQAVRQ